MSRAAFYKYERAIFLAVFSLILCIGNFMYDGAERFNGDDLRYISYAVSLHNHGVFGLAGADIDVAPPPGNANAPIYPAFIAAVMALDDGFAQSLTCITDKGLEAGCALDLQGFFLAQTGLALVSLFLIYMIALRFSGERVVAWLAAFFAAMSGVLTEYSNIFMIGIMILPAFCALFLLCLEFYRKPDWACALGMGLVLAALALMRPSYLYLFYAFALFFLGAGAIKRDKIYFVHVAVFVAAFAVAIMPWAVRNKTYFNSFALAGGNYAEAILIQRTNYNQMSWPEVGVALIYWMPDFGDSLARKIFPAPLHEKLGWGPQSYYAQGYETQIKDLSAELGGVDKILPYLVKEEVMTAKHVAVSVPLALRGVYVAKYWGLAGLIALMALLVRTVRRKDYGLAVMVLPALFMVAFHAGLSVSIPRYNLPLIALYALSLSFYINLYGRKFVAKIISR